MTYTKRTPLVIGNWKLHPAPSDSLWLAGSCAEIAESVRGVVSVGIAVPYPYLPGVAAATSGSCLQIGVQDVSSHDAGAYTGEVAASMVAPWASFTLVGHSERRQQHGETDSIVAAKFRLAVQSGLTAVVCVGETLEQRSRGEAESVVHRQISALAGELTTNAVDVLTIAYEPVWAIGTGQSAAPVDASNMALTIRDALISLGVAAKTVRILYGGSVNSANSASYLTQPGIDGALIGGASLTPGSFAAIVQAAREAG